MPPDITDAHALPALAEIFDALRRGRHLCLEDGALFLHLQAHEARFQQLFVSLGFQFQSHPRGFYYFKGDDSLSDTATKLAVFMFILIEWLADQGQPVADSLLTREFAIDQLPHFSTERFQICMQEVGIKTAAEMDNVVNRLELLGFAVRPAAGRLRFRAPAYRFLDLCLDVLAHLAARPATTTAGEAP